jgi:O-antigen/teichoic acid export membrane protein
MSDARPHVNLTSGRLLARNTIWNLLGALLPMGVAVVSIPPLVNALGLDRFGLLSLAWVVIGYFSLFDAGIGRALTKLVAEKLGANEEHSVPSLIWTSLLLLLALGVLGGLATFAVSSRLVYGMLKIPATLQSEALRSFYLLALSIPTVTVTSGLRGILEAQQRFRLLNLIRIPMSIFSFAGLLLALPFSHNLVPVIAILVVGRIIGLLAHLFACFHTMPLLRHNLSLRRTTIWPLIKLGGWMNLTNLLSPIMVYMDRFLIGSLISVSAVSYYTAPFEIVTRFAVIPGAVTGVLFPAFAASLALDPERTKVLLGRGIKYIFLAVFPIVLLAAAFAPEGLRFWLGNAFAQNGSSVLRWLAAGIFANCLAQLPYVLLQSAGRPDIPAKLQLVELPVYVVGLVLLVRTFGVKGAAIAWASRLMVEALLLFLLAHRLLPHKPGFLLRLSTATTGGYMALYAVTFPESVIIRIGVLILSMLIFGTVTWRLGLEPEERALMRRGRSSPPAKATTMSNVL